MFIVGIVFGTLIFVLSIFAMIKINRGDWDKILGEVIEFDQASQSYTRKAGKATNCLIALSVSALLSCISVTTLVIHLVF